MTGTKQARVEQAAVPQTAREYAEAHRRSLVLDRDRLARRVEDLAAGNRLLGAAVEALARQREEMEAERDRLAAELAEARRINDALREGRQTCREKLASCEAALVACLAALKGGGR